MPIDIPVIVGMSPKPTIGKCIKVYISRRWKSSAFKRCMVSYTSQKQLFGYISVCPTISTNFGMSLGTFSL